jgi:hypothetical protein
MIVKTVIEDDTSTIVQVDRLLDSKQWIAINIYRNNERDDLELTIKEAAQLRDALNEFLNVKN